MTGSEKPLDRRASYHRFRYWVWTWRAFVLGIIGLGLPIYDPASRDVAIIPLIGGALCLWFMLTEDSLEKACAGECPADHKVRRFWQ